MLEQWFARLSEVAPSLGKATIDTLYIVGVSAAFTLFFGFIIAILLIQTGPHGLKPNNRIYPVLDVIVNFLRSFPFIILIICVTPITRLLVGTTIGSTAAIVPLIIGAAPLAARLIEGSFLEVDRGVIEAARSFGANNTQIIFKVLISEATPAIILNVAVIFITLLSYSAMAGAVGGGGLGHLAIATGYNRFQTDMIVYPVIILAVMVQGIQSLGNSLYNKKK